MHGNGHALQCILKLDVTGGLVGGDEFVALIEDAFDHLIDDAVAEPLAGDEIVHHGGGLHVPGLSGVGIGGDDRLHIGRADLVNERAGHLDDGNVERACQIADRGNTKSGRLQGRVELAVLHEIDGFGEGQIFNPAEILVGEAGAGKDGAGVEFGARLRRAD